MRRPAVAAALALATLLALALACGRYGSPHRTRPPAAPVQTVPVTDPAVTP